MSQRAIIHLLALCFALLVPAGGPGSSPVAWAQPAEPATPAARPRRPADLRGEVEELKKELARLREMAAEAAAQAPTLAQSVQEVVARVTAVEQELGQLKRQQAAAPEVVEAIDRLSAEVDAAQRDVEALRTQVAELEQPRSVGGAAAPAEWVGGFRFATSDGAYTLTLGGFVQPRFEVLLPQGADSVTTSTFRLRRARVVAGGQAGRDELTYRLEIELAEPAPGGVPLLDYVVDYQLWPSLALRAGQEKVYFTRAVWAGDGTIDLLERPAVVERLGYDRDIGLWAHGLVLDERIYYRAGLSNGAGPNQLNDNIDFAALVRADGVIVGQRFTPLVNHFAEAEVASLMVGGGAVHDLVRLPTRVAGIDVGNLDVDADGTGDNIRVWSASLDASFRVQRLELVLEGLWRHENWGTILGHSANQSLAEAVRADVDGRRNYLGGYLNASYLILPHRLQVAARGGVHRVALLGLGGGGPETVPPPGDRLWELSGQARYRWSEALLIGLGYTMLDFTASTGPDPVGDRTHTFLADVRLSF